MVPNAWIKSPAARRWIYRVALAVIALLGFYGLVSDESAALWGVLVASVLSLPLAGANTPTSPAQTHRADE